MIKKSVFVLLAALFLLNNAAIAHAQKIYLFTGGDIHDSYIGEAAREDIGKFASLFSWFEPDKQVVYYNQTKQWTGPDIFYSDNVKEAVLTAIQKCPATSSDKIVFYWSGHGAYDENGHYLFMPKDRGPQVMYRSEILKALKKKGASLTVLITDSCHVYHKLPKVAYAQEPRRKCEGLPPLFKSLFFNCNGVISINSSSPGEKSYCTLNGSVFTSNFVDCALDNYDKYWGWEKFLKEVQGSVRTDRYDFLKDLGAPQGFDNPPGFGNQQGVGNQQKKEKELKVDQRIYVWGKLPELLAFPKKSWKVAYQEDDFYERSPFIPIFEPLYFPKKGDIIISVNDTNIQNAALFNRVVSDADRYFQFKLIDHRTGKTMNLITELNPSGSNSRLGISVEDAKDGGAKIVSVMPGTPGEKCIIWRNMFLLGGPDGDSESEDSIQSSDFYPVYGDRIISVNNTKIQNADHFNEVIRKANTQITFTLIDHRTGKTIFLKTNLKPSGSANRLGIDIQNDNLGGVMVKEVKPGSPGEKCYRINNGSVKPIRSY